MQCEISECATGNVKGTLYKRGIYTVAIHESPVNRFRDFIPAIVSTILCNSIYLKYFLIMYAFISSL